MGQTRPGIIRVLIVNDPEGLDVDDGESIPSFIEYCRLPDETVAAFRSRAALDAEARGERMVFFGQQEERPPGYPIPKRRPPNQWLTIEATAETLIVAVDCLGPIAVITSTASN